MAAPMLPGLFSSCVYPAILTAFGVAGNVYLLRGPFKELKDDLGELKIDLGDLLKEVKDDLGEIKGDLDKVKGHTKYLETCQTELELQRMSIAEEIFQHCGNDR